MKKIRKSKRPGYKPKPFYTVKQLFKEAKMCHKVEGEHRQIVLEEFDKVYQRWLQEKAKQKQTKTMINEIMLRLEEMLGEYKDLKNQAEKNQVVDKKWSEKKMEEAEEIFSQIRFVLDLIGFKQGENASNFLKD